MQPQQHAEQDPRVRTEWIRFLFSRIPASFSPKRVLCSAHFGRFSQKEGAGVHSPRPPAAPSLDPPVLTGATDGETVLTLPTEWESHDRTADEQNLMTMTSERHTLQRSSTQDHGAVRTPKHGEQCFLCQEGYTKETPLQENGFSHQTPNRFQAVKTEWEDLNLKEEEEEVCIGNPLLEAPIVKVEIEEVLGVNWGVKTMHVKQEEMELLIQNENMQISGTRELQEVHTTNGGSGVKKEESEEEAITRVKEMLIPNVKEEGGSLIKSEEVCEEVSTSGFNGVPETGFHQPSGSTGSGQSARTNPNQPGATRKGQAEGRGEGRAEGRGEAQTAVWVEGLGDGRPEIQAFLLDHNYTRLRQQQRYLMRSYVRIQQKALCMRESEGEPDSDADQTLGVLHDHQYGPAELRSDAGRSSRNLRDIPPISDSEMDTMEDTSDTLCSSDSSDGTSDSASDTPEVPSKTHMSSCGTSGSSDGSSASSCETPESEVLEKMVFRCLQDHDYCQEYAPQKSRPLLRRSKRNRGATLIPDDPPVTPRPPDPSSDSNAELTKKVSRGVRLRRRTRSRRRKVFSKSRRGSARRTSESVPSPEDPQLCTRCGQVFNLETISEQCVCASCSLSEGALKSSPLPPLLAPTPPVVNFVCSRCHEIFPSHKNFMTHTCSRLMVLNGGSPAPFSQLNNGSSLFSVVGPLNSTLNGLPPPDPTFTVVNTVQRSDVPPTQSLPTPVPPVYQINVLQTGGLLSLRPRVENPADMSTSTSLPPRRPLQKHSSTPVAVLQLSCTKSTPNPPDIRPRQTRRPLSVEEVRRDPSLKKPLDPRWKTKAGFLCRHCGVWSRQPSLGIRHRYQHRGPRPHKCQCGRAFQQRLHLLRHQVQHAEASRYVCATCGRTFHGTQSLAWHQHKVLKSRPPNGQIHTEHKCRTSFPCPCGLTFLRPAALLWHMLKNSEARRTRLKKPGFS